MVHEPNSEVNCTSTASPKYPGTSVLPISTSRTGGGFQAVMHGRGRSALKSKAPARFWGRNAL